MSDVFAVRAMNVDLHCHSTISDGWLAPSDVVRRAARNGVEVLALTDHDEISGLDEARATAKIEGIRLINGVEISVSFLGETVHIVGLDVDDHDPCLLGGLKQVRGGRDERARRMSDALAEVGIRGVLEGARQFARNPELVSRAHFARHLVSTGLMPDVSTVFQHYLVKGKPGFVEHVWASLEEAVAWIRGAGGIAVVAHPARYRFSNAELELLFDRFLACGGEGVEVVSGAHSDNDVTRFAALARRRGLLASRASDFHGAHESPVDLGRCASLPPGLVPVWERFLC